MAGMTGLELAAEIKRRDPCVPVILLSGWAIQEEDAEVKEAGVDRVLLKPCMVMDFLDAVQSVARHPAAVF